VACIHDEADALLPQSEEGEAQDEVGGLGEAVVGQEVLVGALREEQPSRGGRGGLQNRCIDIEAELLVLWLVVDKASGILS
jgi:hypothetical protein